MCICVYMGIDIYFLVKYFSEIGGNKDFKLNSLTVDSLTNFAPYTLLPPAP